MVLLADFRDIVFQADPFAYHTAEWFPEFQLSVFQVCDNPNYYLTPYLYPYPYPYP